jgi:glycogen phosphorylase
VNNFIKTFRESFLYHLIYTFGKDQYSATQRDKYNSFALAVRESLITQWIKTQQEYYYCDAKRVYYLSLEFLLGRLLRNISINLSLPDDYRDALDALGITYEEIVEFERDAGLGNGGLGRLAACFLDSMATLGYPGYGYGIRYEYGIFTQKILDGYQVEFPENWLRYGNPWELPRSELIFPVNFYGRVNTVIRKNGRFRMEWLDTEQVMAMAYDYPIPGYQGNTVNTLRLWSAKSTREFNLNYFNSGDYVRAIEDKTFSETISKVLYPDDHTTAGKELRLKQQYFFVSATLRDIIRRYKKHHQNFKNFAGKIAVQLNDTHPAIAIAELMRLLVDEEGLSWDESWKITERTCSYTNHTVLPEALEIWSEALMGHLLPRHLQIIQEIDRRFLVYIDRKFSGNPDKRRSLAIITGDGEKRVHMARLAMIGSHAVNGVSELHTEILKQKLFHHFYELYPERFLNITNGITPRRWLLEANPGLAALITEGIGDAWITELEALRELESFMDDAEFRKRFREVKKANKASLARILMKEHGMTFHPEFFLDCQIKRFHEYKRQLLTLFHAITLYNRIIGGKAGNDFVPRTILFSGKAAPGYTFCKLIIKLIHCVCDTIRANPVAKKKLQVLFVPNYGVTPAQQIIPAADLSEQISAAGYEASGTSNMKFIMNGAVTIGTMDGSNIEIMNQVGTGNFFLFGMNAEEITELRRTYTPRIFYEENNELRTIINQMAEGHFCPDEPSLFEPIVRALLCEDRYFVLADYAAYISCQERVSAAYRDEELWTRISLYNVARSGRFSSDRTIKEYAEKIWKIPAVPV